MAIARDADSIGRLIRAIQLLPHDKRVADRQPGYNRYNTQIDHWLGWVGENFPGPGTYARKIGKNRGAQYVYNHIFKHQYTGPVAASECETRQSRSGFPSTFYVRPTSAAHQRRPRTILSN
jgi:hypothetical protein